jgi:hypothetical protein
MQGNVTPTARNIVGRYSKETYWLKAQIAAVQEVVLL